MSFLGAKHHHHFWSGSPTSCQGRSLWSSSTSKVRVSGDLSENCTFLPLSSLLFLSDRSSSSSSCLGLPPMAKSRSTILLCFRGRKAVIMEIFWSMSWMSSFTWLNCELTSPSRSETFLPRRTMRPMLSRSLPSSAGRAWCCAEASKPGDSRLPSAEASIRTPLEEVRRFLIAAAALESLSWPIGEGEGLACPPPTPDLRGPATEGEGGTSCSPEMLPRAPPAPAPGPCAAGASCGAFGTAISGVVGFVGTGSVEGCRGPMACDVPRGSHCETLNSMATLACLAAASVP
mmetsp:Transcript_46370/g.148068  ORF Transcript_46370/g.148068 Transcript_46370/m.148068 type:complete len:289 (-) Transcript_46370:846-1712(-)